nr:MAG TPA: YfaZ precursor [Caudoviricetes sp.]
MKKIVLILLCVAILIPAFAETESLVSFGFQYGNYWEKVTKREGTAKTWIGSPGLFFNGYTFFNKKNIGLFASDSFLFPSNSSATVNGMTIKDGVKDFDFRFLFQFGVGPAFKYAITNKLSILIGTGFHLSILSTNRNEMIIGRTAEVRLFSLSFGVMGDIEAIYNITDMLYFNIGTKLALDFANYSKISSDISILNASQWNSNYIGFHLSPYIGLGLKLPF